MEPSSKKTHVLLVGGGAREHAIANALVKTGRVNLAIIAGNPNPALEKLSQLAPMRDDQEESDVGEIAKWADANTIDLVIAGSEEPIAHGLADALDQYGIASIGPSEDAGKIESSKRFARDLMRDHHIPGTVEYHYFSDGDALEQFLTESGKEFALKPVGLTAGKGVKVMGVQLDGVADAVAYGREVIASGIGNEHGIVVEERLLGDEFTLQAFVDGETVVPIPLVRDFKLAYEGDHGPNTGGMGSYSFANGLLPYVDAHQKDQAVRIMEAVVKALRERNTPYHGILYGQFMATPDRIAVVEFNARFGDPEALNVLPLLENDLLDVCWSIINGTLDGINIRFRRLATVCKYITHKDYPGKATPTRVEIDVPKIERSGRTKVFFAKVSGTVEAFLTTGSRSVALVSTGSTVSSAEAELEKVFAAELVRGKVRVRHDIGQHVDEIVSTPAANIVHA